MHKVIENQSSKSSAICRAQVLIAALLWLATWQAPASRAEESNSSSVDAMNVQHAAKTPWDEYTDRVCGVLSKRLHARKIQANYQFYIKVDKAGHITETHVSFFGTPGSQAIPADVRELKRIVSKTRLPAFPSGMQAEIQVLFLGSHHGDVFSSAIGVPATNSY